MFDFSPNRKVVIRNSMRFPLQILSFHSNKGVDSFVVFGEGTKVIAELGGSFPLVDFDLTSQSLEFINIFGTRLFLNNHQSQVELLLVTFLQKGNQKLASFEDIRFHHTVQESLVVDHPLTRLHLSQFLLCQGRQWWNNSLRELSQQVVSQSFKVGI